MPLLNFLPFKILASSSSAATPEALSSAPGAEVAEFSETRIQLDVNNYVNN
jgi:hypothetical protein